MALGRSARGSLGLILGAALMACRLLAGAGMESPPTDPESPAPGASGATLATQVRPPAGPVILPEAFEYLGAFRLPGGDERPETFAYGGNAMTYRPEGDPDGPSDGFPGSLYITGHPRLPYGELPNGDQVAEVDIPVPISSRNLESLNRAELLHGFENVAAGQFPGLDEITRVGLLYLDHPATGPRLHLAWGQHLEPEGPVASHAWIDPALDDPHFAGPWSLNVPTPYSTNGYLLEIPQDWAQAFVGGFPIGTGRFRDGGWSGMGPTLHVYRPWTDESGTPARAGSLLPVVTLLQYESSERTNSFEHALADYQHPDEWEGAAWLTTAEGDSAVLFAGTKSAGEKYWYGYVNPAGADQPCVDQELVGQYTVCREADGRACPESDLRECSGHTDYRGWWSTRFEASFLLYDPADLARVVSGELATWEPQPYARMRIDDVLYLNPSGVEADMLGTGDQRRFRLGEAAFDRARGLLYVLELFADGARPVVHAWHVG